MWLKPFPLKQWKEQPCFPGFSQVFDSKSISVIKVKCWLTRELLSIVCLVQVWCFWFHGINGLQELVAVRWVVKQWGRCWQLKSRLKTERVFHTHSYCGHYSPISMWSHILTTAESECEIEGSCCGDGCHQHPLLIPITAAIHKLICGEWRASVQGWGGDAMETEGEGREGLTFQFA